LQDHQIGFNDIFWWWQNICHEVLALDDLIVNCPGHLDFSDHAQCYGHADDETDSYNSSHKNHLLRQTELGKQILH